MRTRCLSRRPRNGSRMVGWLALTVLLLLVNANAGFGWPLESLATGALGPVAGSSPGAADTGMFSNLITWLGKFHPPTVNFPIALLLAAALAEILWAVTEQPGFRFASRFCIWLGALGAVAGSILGWFFAGFRLTDPSWILTTHRWLGTGTSVWALLVLILSEQSRRRNNPRLETTFWATLFIGAALVSTTGFFGGAMIYGIDHYAWPEQAKTTTGEPAKEETAEPEADEEEAEADAVVKMTDDWTYEPEKVTIEAGQTIRWDCDSTYMHTVTADPKEANDREHVKLPEGAETFDSGEIQPGESFSRTFNVPGHYRYFCIPHEAAGMIGEIEVTPK